MSGFRTAAMVVRSTERIAYGFADHRALFGTYVSPTTEPGAFLWPFDAEARGYDMAIWRGPYQHRGRIA